VANLVKVNKQMLELLKELGLRAADFEAGRMTTRKCRLYIDDYMEAIESGKIPASRRLRKAMPYIRSKLDAPGVYIDEEKAKKAVELIEKYSRLSWCLGSFLLLPLFTPTMKTVRWYSQSSSS